MYEISGVLRGFIEEVLNQGHIEATGRFFWEDMAEQAPFPGQGPGLEGLKDVLRGMRAAFPDMGRSELHHGSNRLFLGGLTSR
ncbi:MAG: ester cyclase [Pararobbsia sp.]